MPLLKGIVCNKKAYVEGYRGTSGVVDDTIYEFYFLESINDESYLGKVKTAAVVTQTGGVGTGLFKIPLVGERVLIIQDGSGENSNYYLLGYLPSKEEMPYTSAPIRKEEEEEEAYKKRLRNYEERNLRLKKSGLAHRYMHDGYSVSEISFYSQKDTGMGSNNADMINIESSGGTAITAGERLYQRAETLQIKIGGSELDVEFDKENPETHPIGDRPGESPSNGKGDIDMRAANNIVIKAANSIKLQVGRTILTIKDSGFEVVTKKINSNWPLSTIDTKFSMKPRTGINMYGNSVAIEANSSASIKDSWGGSLSLNTGVASLTGREASVNGIAGAAYKWFVIKNALDTMLNLSFGCSCAMTTKDPNKIFGGVSGGESAQVVFTSLKKIVGYFEQIDGLQSARKNMLNREVVAVKVKEFKEEIERKVSALKQTELNALDAEEQTRKTGIDDAENKTDEEKAADKKEVERDIAQRKAAVPEKTYKDYLGNTVFLEEYNGLYDQKYGEIHFRGFKSEFWQGINPYKKFENATGGKLATP